MKRQKFSLTRIHLFILAFQLMMVGGFVHFNHFRKTTDHETSQESTQPAQVIRFGTDVASASLPRIQ